MDPEKEEDQADEGTVSNAHARYMENIVTVPCRQEKEGRRHQKGSRNDACPFRDVPVWRITVKADKDKLITTKGMAYRDGRQTCQKTGGSSII